MATGTAFPRRSRTSGSGDDRARAGAERPVWRRWVVATTLGELLGFLIPVAVVANLASRLANVLLPSIGVAFDSSQTALDLVAVG